MKVVKISFVAIMAFSLLGSTAFANESDDNKLDEIFNMPQQETGFEQIMASYSSIKDALVADDAKTAQMKARELMKMNDILQENAKAIAESTDLAEQRKFFGKLSKQVYQMAKNEDFKKSIYWNHCPMALNGKGANWLSMNEKIRNPYMGQKMPSCGSVQETLKKQ